MHRDFSPLPLFPPFASHDPKRPSNSLYRQFILLVTNIANIEKCCGFSVGVNSRATGSSDIRILSFMHMFKWAYIYAFITWRYAHTDSLHIRVRTCLYARTFVHIHIYTDVHTHVYVCASAASICLNIYKIFFDICMYSIIVHLKLNKRSLICWGKGCIHIIISGRDLRGRSFTILGRSFLFDNSKPIAKMAQDNRDTFHLFSVY